MDTIEDIERNQRAERAKVRDDASLFEGLVASPGWARYVALIEAVGQNYHMTIMKPLENILECGKVEFAKGALSGLSLATALPHMKIKEAQELRRGAVDDEE